MESLCLNLASSDDVIDSEINLDFISIDIDDSPSGDNKENTVIKSHCRTSSGHWQTAREDWNKNVIKPIEKAAIKPLDSLANGLQSLVNKITGKIITKSN